MTDSTQIEALMTVLHTIVDGHPRPALVLAQVDGLIAEMQVQEEEGQDVAALREAVEQVKQVLF